MPIAFLEWVFITLEQRIKRMRPKDRARYKKNRIKDEYHNQMRKQAWGEP